MKEKLCKCGNIFIPYMEGQNRCVYCILQEEPEQPAENLGLESPAFVDWFIYHWHNIRKAAAIKRGVEFEWDDGVLGKEEPKPLSIAEMARKHGLKPRTVTMRISRGWSLQEALEGKRRK